MRAIAVTAALVLLLAHRPMHAQARLPTDGGTTTSLGQPGPWAWSLGVGLGFRQEAALVTGMGEARIGVYHELLSRALGVGGLQAEVYNQSINAKYAVGARARWVSQCTGIAIGAAYSATDNELRPIFTYVHPIRRGGLFRDGSVARVDVVTGPQHSITLGVERPMFRRIPMGTTRPRTDVAKLPPGRRPASTPAPQSADLTAALNEARDAAMHIQRLCVPWLDHTGRGGASGDAVVLSRIEELRRLVSADGAGRNIDGEARRLHDAMDRAFGIAAGALAAGSPADAGAYIGNRARAILMSEVLLPYNRMLGQVKEEDSTHGYAVLASGTFLRWLHVQSGLRPAATNAVMDVFHAMLDMVEDARASTHRQWGTSRFVWLPLQLGLRAEQYDTQQELDLVVEQATVERFTEGNAVSYVINEQFQHQLHRTIHAARSYHVLWTHDFRGTDARGDPDHMAYQHVLHSYLAALTARVREYDSTGTLPTYIVLLDEWFYEVNNGRVWMDLLEDPTRHRVRLGTRFAAMEDSLRRAQDALRDAIAGSALLSGQRRQFGEAWLRNLVKVHVNITNASDPSFWSWKVVTGFPLPDTWMRDHRKIVFYDVTEADPFSGEALLTGAGIGEHYANQSWEDRSILVRGPALLPLKTAARDALIKQGVRAAFLPAALQPRELPRDYHDRIGGAVRGGERTLRAMQLHNGTGFDDKQVNVAKAVLYTLMPPGSVIKIPDSLWNGTFWGSALIGCALRGVRVVVIAPSLENAPARAFGSMVRSRELLWRLVMSSRMLATEIAASGGMLKVGMYTSSLPVNDVKGRLAAMNSAFAQHAWLRELFPLSPSFLPRMLQLSASLDSAAVLARGEDRYRGDFESNGRALLHLKANFFASGDAWSVMSREEWADVSKAFMLQRIEQIGRQSVDLGSARQVVDTTLRATDTVVSDWYDALPAARRERVLFYTVLGSANQNDRSMVSDGEDALVLSSWPAVIPYLDLLLLVGQSEWIERPEELDALLPRQGRLRTMLAHWFKFVF